MITFTKLGEQGRLGNQLFQYAALKGLAAKNNFTVKIPDPKTKSCHNQPCLLEYLNLDVEYLSNSEYKDIKYSYSEPDHLSIDPNFFSIRDYTDLGGYFQSMFYFEHIEEAIKKELTPREDFHIQATKSLDELRNESGRELVAIHTRRGDNVDNSILQPLNYSFMYEEGNIYYKYILDALGSVFNEDKYLYLLFIGGARTPSGTSEEDQDWVTKTFPLDYRFILMRSNSTIMDMALISNCDHNIMSHISSFGWWAAYLNTNPNRITVAPKHYIPEMPSYIRPNFYPENYILI